MTAAISLILGPNHPDCICTDGECWTETCPPCLANDSGNGGACAGPVVA